MIILKEKNKSSYAFPLKSHNNFPKNVQSALHAMVWPIFAQKLQCYKQRARYPIKHSQDLLRSLQSRSWPTGL